MTNPEMMDRAIGAIVGSACGDALGAPYEFRSSVPDGRPIVLKAGGPWRLGEWTDDTSMAVPILQAVAARRPLDGSRTLDEIVRRWVDWSRGAKDIGIQTSRVIRGLTAPTAAAAYESARSVHQQTGRSGGNGSLMRTGPVALARLWVDDDRAESSVAENARRISDLTHVDPDAGDACVLWALAIRHAIRHGEYDLRAGIDRLPAARRTRWHTLIDDAEGRHPRHYERQSGWVVGAFQAAWAAIDGATGYADAVERAVRVGGDTDTVAAIAGALAGARWGYSAVPWAWRRHLHGWPGLTGDELVELAYQAANPVAMTEGTWPLVDRMPIAARLDSPVRHPHDDGVWLGDLAGLDALPTDCDAVVSLCRVGRDQVPVPRGDRATFWLVDRVGANPNVDIVLCEAADAVATLRAEGRTVYLHCVAAESRTPSVAVAYAVRHRGASLGPARAAIRAVLPGALTRGVFDDALTRVRA